jgi:two-component system, NarL family, nitrate/nitrite sensor histidine kinase NarX
LIRMAKTTGVQPRMGLLLLAFFLLVIVSAGLTFWGIDQQKQDGLIINLAGRQRMFIQQMTRLALEIERSPDNLPKSELERVMSDFSETLLAFRDGGQAPYQANRVIQLQIVQDPHIQDQIGQIEQSWADFQANLDILLHQPSNSAAFEASIRNVETQSPLLIQQADALVRQYEALSIFRLNRLRIIQIGFAGAALILLGFGALVTRRSILTPLQELETAARRIGAGDLSTSVNPAGPGEIELLGATLESMRFSLLASKAELLAWTETLEQRVDQRTQELAALNAVSREINSRLDINEVLHSITEKACLLLNVDVAFLCLLDGSQAILKLHAAQGPVDAIEKFSSPADAEYAGQVLASQQAVQCNLHDCQGLCEIMTEPYRRSHLAASLKVGNRIIGALCVGSKLKDYFQPEAAELLTRLANIAAIALENARLYEQAERSATLEERQRIAAEMHDGLAQTLGYLQMTMDQISTLVEQGQLEPARRMFERVQAVIDQANLDVRRSISRLNEDIPLHFTLQEQLQRLAEECSSDERMVEWQNNLPSPLVLPRQEMEQVLRVAREALFNAKAHSQAQQIGLELVENGERVAIIVTDDGIGFDPGKTAQPDGRQHFGLSIMRARAARINADLNIHSAPGEGTRLILSWTPGAELSNDPTKTSTGSPVLLREI